MLLPTTFNSSSSSRILLQRSRSTKGQTSTKHKTESYLSHGHVPSQPQLAYGGLDSALEIGWDHHKLLQLHWNKPFPQNASKVGLWAARKCTAMVRFPAIEREISRSSVNTIQMYQLDCIFFIPKGQLWFGEIWDRCQTFCSHLPSPPFSQGDQATTEWTRM